jgi:hypothetical protein
MKRIYLYIILCSTFLWGACNDVDTTQPIGSKTPPAQILNPRVKNIDGASIIYFDRPDDINLKYIKAVYTTESGTKFDANASFYTDSILIEGFGSAGEYEVKLYSVSTGEVYSEPVIVKINPETPPYLTVYENIEIAPTFAGIYVKTKNETKAKLSLFAYRKDNADEEWQEINAYYTTANNIAYAVRGQDTISAEFGIKVRDRWGHWSDIKTITTIPWYEMKCDKSKFKEVINLPSDTRIQHTWSGSQTSFAALWDERAWTSAAYCFHTRAAYDPMPQHFTIDLGEVYSLSRMLVRGRGQSKTQGASSDVFDFSFDSGYPLQIQILVSTELSDLNNLADDISDPSWIPAITGEDGFMKRADGTTTSAKVVALTDEDKIILDRGQEFEFPAGVRGRFIRFRTMSTYGAVNSVMLDELTFFGSNK